jgi:tellurite resistance protein
MLSKQAALIYVMIMVSASDRAMKPTELSTIGSIVKRLPAFAGYDVTSLPQTAESCAEMLSGQDGMHAALNAVAESLPQPLRDTAYALALEVAAADRRLNREELRILQIISERLAIDPDTASALERSVSVRYAEA